MLSYGANILLLNLTASGALTYDGVTGLTISNKKMEGLSTNAVLLLNCNDVVIDGLFGLNIDEPVVYLFNCNNVLIRNLIVDNVNSGIYAQQCTDVKIEFSSFRDVYRKFDGSGNRINQYGQAVQFNNCSGVSYIKELAIQNELGNSNPEDLINIYQSDFTAANPLIVENIRAIGGGDSPSGGGILLGDSGGTYQIARNNILVNPGQYGMAIAGGSFNTLDQNTVFGVAQPFTNVGVYAWDQYNSSSQENRVTNHRINYDRSDGVPNGLWINANAGVIDQSGNNINDDTLTADILPSNIFTPFLTEPTSGLFTNPTRPDGTAVELLLRPDGSIAYQL